MNSEALKIGITKSLAYVFFFAAGFMLAWFVKPQINNSVQPPTAVTEEALAKEQPEVSDEAQTAAPVTVTEYEVSASKGRLCLFEITGDSMTLIKSINIEEELFPAADREMLSQGIKAATKEEALMIWESYT